MLEGKIQVRKYPTEGLVIFTFNGDFVEPEYIANIVAPTINDFKFIVLDVQNLEYINSASFGYFFEIASRAEQNKSKLCFMNLNKKFKIIYNNLGAAKIFNVIASLNELQQS